MSLPIKSAEKITAGKKSRRKFLHYFPKGFRDPKYLDWERNYKWQAHAAWMQDLHQEAYAKLLAAGKYSEIAQRAVNIEAKTNLLFSFEKMALRDAVKSKEAAARFAKGLYDYVYGKADLETRFNNFTRVLAGLPRKQTRVLTWPLQTVFGFIANPKEHIFVKPRVTQKAAEKYVYTFAYESRPNWETYRSMLDFAKKVRDDVSDLKPKDMIDIQSYIWVQGSDEYAA